MYVHLRAGSPRTNPYAMHGNIGLSDGGTIKGVPKDGIQDTVVDRANFGKCLREQPTAGMIDADRPGPTNPSRPTQHGPPATTAAARDSTTSKLW